MSRITTGLAVSIVVLFVAAGAGVLRGSAQPSSPALKDEVVVCRNDVMPEVVQQANASFSAIYRLNTGRSGEVEEVTRLRNFPWPDKMLSDCLRRWRFPVAKKEVTVMLNWKHGAGWTSISINIPGFLPRIIRTPSYEAGNLAPLP